MSTHILVVLIAIATFWPLIIFCLVIAIYPVLWIIGGIVGLIKAPFVIISELWDGSKYCFRTHRADRAYESKWKERLEFKRSVQETFNECNRLGIRISAARRYEVTKCGPSYLDKYYGPAIYPK